MRPLKQTRHASYVVLLAALLTVVGCGGGGGSSSGGGGGDGADLVLIDASVGDMDGVALNTTIALEFSAKVDPDSVTPETIRIRETPGGAVQVPGAFRVDGRVVTFVAKLPTSADLSDSGLKPGRTYEIVVPGPGSPNTLRDRNGDRIVAAYRTQFATAGLSSPDLFIDNFASAAPHVVAMNPAADAVDVPQSADITVTLSEPVHPATLTPGNVRLTMVERPAGTPLSMERPITGRILIDQSRESVTLSFLPDFPLADNARYRFEIDRRVTDLAGNDFDEYRSHFTLRDEPPVPDAFTLGFGAGTEVYQDEPATISSWNETMPGRLAAVYTFGGGDGAHGDFNPTFDTTLNGNTAENGVFRFRSFSIPAGVTVRVTGDRPVTIRSLKPVRIEGVLDASGRKGADSEPTSATTGVPTTLGGQPGPGGGKGGSVFTNVPTKRTSSYKGNRGEDGQDGFGTADTGGTAATWGSVFNYKSGAGGGGGAHAQEGQSGGASSNFSSVRRGVPGDEGEADFDDTFATLTAGGGGGAGMNGWYYWTPRSHGASAGGGGGGGLAIECAQDIEILGEILADGGDGGDVITPTNSYTAGAGGAGAGGMIVLRATRSVKFTGAKVSAVGGEGGLGGQRYGGNGGDGGDGALHFADSDGTMDVAGATFAPAPSPTGVFRPTSGAPSVARTVWINLGVLDPIFSAGEMSAEVPMPGQTVKVEVQGAREDLFDLGNPDLDSATEWVDLEALDTLNARGVSFVRIRVTFTLAAGQQLEDALPSVDSIRLPYTY